MLAKTPGLTTVVAITLAVDMIHRSWHDGCHAAKPSI